MNQDLRDIQAKLGEPFPPTVVKERIQSYTKQRIADGFPDGTEGLLVSYIDARDAMDRLDAVVGVFGWSDNYELLPKDDKGRIPVKCSLTVLGTTKSDIGYPNSDKDDEPLKAAVSDAFKRAAIRHGVGRHLYDIKPRRVPVDKYGRVSRSGTPQESSTPRQSPPVVAANTVPTGDLATPAQWKLIEKLASERSNGNNILETFLKEKGARTEITKRQASEIIDALRAP